MSGFSLPTQRCFLPWIAIVFGMALFSAYAEVFLTETAVALQGGTFLCLRRGVSIERMGYGPIIPFSLPTQRCFFEFRCRCATLELFSAYAEVFLDQLALGGGLATFLCLRRGVSSPIPDAKRRRAFSLPTQRCFSQHGCASFDGALFSAYAEVFPSPPARSYRP